RAWTSTILAIARVRSKGVGGGEKGVRARTVAPAPSVRPAADTRPATCRRRAPAAAPAATRQRALREHRRFPSSLRRDRRAQARRSTPRSQPAPAAPRRTLAAGG